MALISKETELQEELTAVYELLLIKKERVKEELIISRKDFNRACDLHIRNGFKCDKDWISADISHQHKFIEYEMYCHIIEILNDFRDIYGQFPEYLEMYSTLNHIMIQLADEEKYELAAITKLWVDKLDEAIQEHIYC